MAADPHPATVFVTRSRQGQLYARGLARLGVAFERYRAGDFTVYEPAHTVDFEHVLAVGHQPAPPGPTTR